jgi:hypothetical protein
MIPNRRNSAHDIRGDDRMKPQVIDRLAQRSLKPPAHCRLGSEARRRRGGSCSACRPPQEFEIDQAIAQLIDSGAFARAGVCPYQVVASHLVAALTLGPEISRARSASRLRIDPVVEVKGALKRIRTLLFSGPSRDNIEAIASTNDGARWQPSLAAWTNWSAAQSSCGAGNGGRLARADRTPAGQSQFQVSRSAPGRERQYLRASRRRAKFGMGDKDGGGTHHKGCGRQELMSGNFLFINTRLPRG